MQIFLEIGVLKVCNIHRKMSVLESLFSKITSLEACNFIKNRLQHRCFPVNIAEFLIKLFFKEHYWWLLLYYKFIGNSMTFINPDDIYFQYDALCLYHHVFLHFFRYQFLLKLLKHVKLIVFENYNECKAKHLFLIKK